MNERKLRNEKGAAITGLVLALFLFIMLCGFFTFDASRLQMAQRELTATCDAAALAGTAMLTSYDTSNDNAANVKLIQAQQYACGYARNMFQAGNLLGQSLVNATPVSPYSAVGVAGTPGSCNVMISLADPLNNYAGVSPVSPACVNGRAIMVYAGYTYTPVFLGMIGVGKVVLNANSGGGLPQVDTVLVFDYSGSMDDATNVTYIRRTWDSTCGPINGGALSAGRTDYVDNTLWPTTPVTGTNHGGVHYIVVPPNNTGSTSHSLAGDGSGTSGYLQHDYTNKPEGTNVNVLPPMNLEISDNSDSLAPVKYVFDFNLRCNNIPNNSLVLKKPGSSPIPGAMQLLMNDYGSPPGNCTLEAPYGFGAYYNENGATQMSLVAPANAAYNTNAGYCPPPNFNGSPTVINLLKTTEHPGSNSWVGSAQGNNYNAWNNTGTDRHVFTDLVVNIGNPGTWPYNQPLTGPTTFVGFSYTFPSQEPDTDIQGGTFNFENLGVVCEAARGNLDSATYFNRATLDRGSWITTKSDPNDGTALSKQPTGMTSAHCAQFYQKAYTRLAMLFSQPLATAVDGAYGGFVQKINSLTDSRFGFVAFSNASEALANPNGPNFDTGGSAHGTTLNSHNSYFYSVYNCQNSTFNPTNSKDPDVLWNSNQNGGAENQTSIGGGSGTGFRQPRIELDQTISQANSYGGVVGGMNSTTATANSSPWSADSSDSNANGLENGRPLDNTDTYEAINTAYQMFHNGTKYDITTVANSRPAAKHAIVFFTDGVPTGGSGGADASSAQGVAPMCKTDGIAIFCIGLNLTGNSVFTNSQITFMGNTAPGLSGAAGNGGKFFPCAQASDVRQAFAAVARRLSQSQR
jgi:hypothetical protein